ncbi:MAG: tripartite tricarboxylate transporter TctB family protein [Deltaproteobacteria bacterium]|nr:tripartite tricarboxylate transporter TctB family protein [Deltaproteobacteria bacterium]
MTKDRYVGIFSVLAGLVYLASAIAIPVFEVSDDIGPRTFPILVSIVVIICGTFVLINDIRSTKRTVFSWQFIVQKDIWLRIALTIAGGIVYGLVLDWLGYVITTFIFMSYVFSYINVGKYVENIFIAFAFSTISYTVFAIILKLSLPRGLLGEILPF